LTKFQNFGFSPNLTIFYEIFTIFNESYEISRKLTQFHKISNFQLQFCSILMYFIDFCFCFWCFQKLTAKFGLIWNFKISDLTMVKVEKVNIAVMYEGLHFNRLPCLKVLDWGRCVWHLQKTNLNFIITWSHKNCRNRLQKRKLLSFVTSQAYGKRSNIPRCCKACFIKLLH
jgi:hypothetical protein